MRKIKFSESILEATDYCMEVDPSVLIIGLGVPDPGGVFGTTLGLQEKYGEERVMDMPLSENCMTGVIMGAALNGFRPILTHQRVEFSLLSIDQIVNQAAKWYYMNAGQQNVPIVIRLIIGRGWGQGPQHAQSLESWFAHVPGLRVVMPSTVADARDLLIASVLCNDPVMFIDDRWLYDQEDDLPPIVEIDLATQRPIVSLRGSDITIVASGHSSLLAREAAQLLKSKDISVEVVDIRVLNPLHTEVIIESVKKTKNLLVVDSGWTSGGFSAEIIAKVVEQLPVDCLNNPPVRIALPDAPAPTSRVLEKAYYTSTDDLVEAIKKILKK